MHELALRYGPLKDVDTTFRTVDWTGESCQHAGDPEPSVQRRMARIHDGESVSPKSKPRLEQMSSEEFRKAMEVRKETRPAEQP